MSTAYYDENCIFCKILQGQIPSTVLFESDAFLVFLDINPVNKGHALIIPKRHMETVFDLESGCGEELVGVMRRVGRAIMEATGATGLNGLQNNYADAGQAVPHVHWHLIPRFAGDGLLPWNPKGYADGQEMTSLAEKIRASL